jgi:alkanesulfonate monooxygenase SsuD/methylene tetrahydromethanopterin reductase-like flavin-dependent oxidoreductase (luciferase family)
MKLSMLIDGDCTGSAGPAARYAEMIREAELADELGFHAWGVPEQHFAAPRMTTSAPDVILSAVAARTERIKIRYSAIALHRWNHPVNIAERVALLDNISNGRAELCTARGNDLPTMVAFEIEPSQTREMWADSVRAVAAILGSQDAFEYHGEFWEIPATGKPLAPQTLQKPHPPISVVASSPTSTKAGGKLGLGGFFLDNYLGWDYIQPCIDAYREGARDPEPIVERTHNHLAFYCPSACCRSTTEKAMSDGAIQAVPWFESILKQYEPLWKKPGYEYMQEMESVAEHRTDMAWMREHTPSVLVGTPDEIIETLQELERRGVDEVLMRIDGWGHEHHMETIEMLGKHVIPVVDKPAVAAEAAA